MWFQALSLVVATALLWYAVRILHADLQAD